MRVSSGVFAETLLDMAASEQLYACKRTSGDIEKRIEISKAVQENVQLEQQLYSPVSVPSWQHRIVFLYCILFWICVLCEQSWNFFNTSYVLFPLQLSTHGSILYFAIQKLQTICPLYQYSGMWFQAIFTSTISQFELAQTHAERMEDDSGIVIAARHSESDFVLAAKNAVTRDVLAAVGCGLSPPHRHLFHLLVAIKSLEHSCPASVTAKHWHAFLNAPQHDQQSSTEYKNPSWLPASAWLQCMHLNVHLPAFRTLCSHMAKNAKQWKAWLSCPDPWSALTEAITPGDGDKFRTDALNLFERLILVRVLRLEYLLAAVEKFTAEVLGTTLPAVLNLQDIVEKFPRQQPVIFILSPGMSC